MKNWKLVPQNINIAKYVECYWFLEKEQSDISNSYPKLNPDPAAHLIITDNHQKYQYQQGDIIQKGYGSHWIFPHRNTFVMDHSDPFRILGIKFTIGALYPLALSDVQFELDKVESINISELVDIESYDMDKLLENAIENPKTIRDTLDGILASCISQSQEDRHSELTRSILPLLPNQAIAQIGGILHRSQRTIERSFLKSTGLTLKQCQSMIHLEDMLNHLHQLTTDNINWADLANQFGFSDQPHLIRYLKSSIGETPSEYSLKRNLTIDIYGNFEFTE